VTAPPTPLGTAAARLEAVAAEIRTAPPERLEALADEALALAATIAEELREALRDAPPSP
jgi:hypothetical protein